MKWPARETELEAAGWRYEKPGTCSACGVPMEWWRTPQGKLAPLTAVGFSDHFQSHFADCPKAEQFRKKKAKGASA